MPEEQKSTPAEEVRWSIALDWFLLNQRSALVLIQGYLCSNCARRVSDKKDPNMKTILGAIQKCCSQTPDFFNDKLPILESIFRLFLRNGNKPLTLKELSSELGQVRSGDIYRTSPEILLRLLKNDRFYGLQEIPG
jgi:hypothetical protein